MFEVWWLFSDDCYKFTAESPPPPHHATTVLRPFFRDHPGEHWAGARRELLDFVVQGRLTKAGTLTIRLSATPSGLSSAHRHHPPFFYRPDALPAAQPTVLKHWRQLANNSPISPDWRQQRRLATQLLFIHPSSGLTFTGTVALKPAYVCVCVCVYVCCQQSPSHASIADCKLLI